MRLVLVGIVVAAVAYGAPIHSPAEGPAGGLEGTWEITSQQYNGAPAFRCENSSMSFTRDKMFLVQKGKKVAYSYTTDPKARPRQLDLVALDEPFKNQTFEAIYEVDGDTLKVNMGGLPGVKRPTEFGLEKEKGPRHWAFSLKRVKE